MWHGGGSGGGSHCRPRTMIPLKLWVPLPHKGNLAGGGPRHRRPPVMMRLPPTMQLDAAESPAVDAFVEAIGVGGGVRRLL